MYDTYAILNSWERRSYLSITLFALHCFVFQKFLGYFLSFLLTNILCVLFLLYLHRQDKILSINYGKIIYSLIFILYFITIIIFFKPPLISEFILIFIQQASFEEIYFRFFMIGINKKHYTDTKTTLKTIILNNLFFITFHLRTFNNLIQVFLLGLIFTYVYLNTDIISSIISHAIWNLYLPSSTSAYFVLPVLILPIIRSYLYPSLFSIDLLKKRVCECVGGC